MLSECLKVCTDKRRKIKVIRNKTSQCKNTRSTRKTKSKYAIRLLPVTGKVAMITHWVCRGDLCVRFAFEEDPIDEYLGPCSQPMSGPTRGRWPGHAATTRTWPVFILGRHLLTSSFYMRNKQSFCKICNGCFLFILLSIHL